MSDLSVVKEFPQLVSTPLVYKSIQRSIFKEVMLWGLLLSRGLNSYTTYTDREKSANLFKNKLNCTK
jgi:hypothetical protein